MIDSIIVWIQAFWKRLIFSKLVNSSTGIFNRLKREFLLTIPFYLAGLSAAHFCADLLLDWTFPAKWARLLITFNCCLSNRGKVQTHSGLSRWERVDAFVYLRPPLSKGFPSLTREACLIHSRYELLSLSH